MKIQEYLNKKGYTYTNLSRPSGLNGIMNCPKCNDTEKKFAINLETGAFNCLHTNSCGWTGSWYDFQNWHGDKPKKIIKEKYFKKTKKVYDLPKKEDSELSDGIIQWFSKRGLKSNVLKKYGLSKHNKEIVFNYTLDGQIKHIKYRTKDKKFRQSKNTAPILYGMDLVNSDEELVIVEGEIDCITLYQYGIDRVVSIPSGVTDKRWIEENWEWLEKFKRIYICMDMDSAGRKEVENIADRLGKWRCYDMELPYKDANECLLKGVEYDKIIECMINARGFDREEIINAEDCRDEIIDTILHPEKYEGRKLNNHLIDKILKGRRDGEVSIWTGKSGSGKTTYLMQLAILDSLCNGIPMCIGSFEMPPGTILSWATLQMHYQLERSENHTSIYRPIESRINKIVDQMSNIYVINIKDRIEEDQLMDLFEYAAMKYGCKIFILDSLMRIKLNRNEDILSSQDDFITRLSNFAHKYNSHVDLVAHPRKSQGGNNDRPGKDDIKGSGGITDIAHNVISIYRLSDEQKKALREDGFEPYDARADITKNRIHGIHGHVKMNFNPEFKTFTEIL